MSALDTAQDAAFALQLKLQGKDLLFRDGIVRGLVNRTVDPQDAEPRENFDQRVNCTVALKPMADPSQLPIAGEEFITPDRLRLRIQEVQPLDSWVRCFCSGSFMS